MNKCASCGSILQYCIVCRRYERCDNCDPLHGHPEKEWRAKQRAIERAEFAEVALKTIVGGVLILALGIAILLIFAAVLLWALRYLGLNFWE